MFEIPAVIPVEQIAKPKRQGKHEVEGRGIGNQIDLPKRCQCGTRMPNSKATLPE